MIAIQFEAAPLREILIEYTGYKNKPLNNFGLSVMYENIADSIMAELEDQMTKL